MSKPILPERKIEREAEAARDLMQVIAESVTDDPDLAADMIEGETQLIEALESAVHAIRECDVIKDGCAAEIERLTARKRRAEGREKTLRAAIERAMVMVNLDTIALPTKTLTIAHRKGVAVITDEAAIPAEFWTPQPPKLDKKALNDAVANRDVPGAHQGNGTVSLTIRSK